LTYQVSLLEHNVMKSTRKSYPCDVTDAEWEFLGPYLTLLSEYAPQREYALRELFVALRYVVKTGCEWRFLPHDFPPWSAVYQQARRLPAAATRIPVRMIATPTQFPVKNMPPRFCGDDRIYVRAFRGRPNQPLWHLSGA
jgi:transposase